MSMKFIRMAILMALLLTGCAGQNEGDLEPAIADMPEIIIEPTLTTAPSPTATLSPTDAPEPTPVTIQEPFAGMKSPGPWMVFHTNKGTYIVSHDGSEVGFIPTTEDAYYRTSEAAPSGGLIATTSRPASWWENSQPESFLEIRSITSNEVLFQFDLMPYNEKGHRYPIPEEAGQFEWDRISAVGRENWSHDGTKLAFNASISNRSSDLLIYSLEDGTITQVTNTPEHAVNSFWSPDDKRIVHPDVSLLYFENNGSGYQEWKFYSSKPDGSDTISISVSPLVSNRSLEEVVGWISDTEFILTRGYWWCGITEISIINILSGVETPIYSKLLDRVAFNPDSQKLLAWVGSGKSTIEECIPELESGFHLISITNGFYERLDGLEEIEIAYSISYDEHNNEFLIEGNSYSYLVSNEGEINFKGSDKLYPSPDGNWIILEDRSTAVVNRYTNDLIDIETQGETDNPIWDLDSSSFFFFQESNKGFSLFKATAPEFEPELVLKDVGYLDNPPIWVNP